MDRFGLSNAIRLAQAVETKIKDDKNYLIYLVDGLDKAQTGTQRLKLLSRLVKMINDNTRPNKFHNSSMPKQGQALNTLTRAARMVGKT